MHELPLVFFTVFGQLAAGALVITAISSLLTAQSVSIVLKINSAALVIMALAMFIASFHLGHPFRAFNVIFGIGRSPMSNEIFTFGLLFGLTAGNVILLYLKQNHLAHAPVALKKMQAVVNRIAHLPTIFAALQIVLSLFFVWTIVLTYKLPTVPTWDTPYTAIFMYTTLFTLGGALCALFGLGRLAMTIFFISTSLSILLTMPYFTLIASIAPDLAQQHVVWFIAKSALLISSLILGLFTLCGKPKAVTMSITIKAVIFILALQGELCGRIAFYNLWQIAM